MKRVGISITAAALLLCASGCSRQQKVEASATPAPQTNARPGQAVIPPDSPQLAQIKVEKVKLEMVPVDGVSAPAKVEANANRLSHVVLPIAGRIVSVNAKIGDFVQQGQPIVTIESPDADAAISAHLQNQAGVTQAKSALAKAQTDLDRQKDLYEHGAVPQKEVLNAQAVLVQAQAAVEQAQAAAEQSRRKLEILGLNPGGFGQRVTVTAPISGKVLDMSVVNGEFRNDLSAPLMTIADLSSVWVTSDVPETSIREVKPGEVIRVELDAYPGTKLNGRVTQIGDTVDPQSRTIKVRAELANRDGRLKPEMFGRMQLTEVTESRPTVPVAAVAAQDGRTYVWRQLSKGTFERTPVTIGAQIGDRVAVLSGLGANDSVVVDGVMLLHEN